MKAFRAALRELSEVVDVPGTPRSLRIDAVERVEGRVRVTWSFEDPEVLIGERHRHGRRVRGHLDARSTNPARAADVWSGVQLAAGHAYVRQVDADWDPGQPYVRHTWTAEEAWDALLQHLRNQWAEVVAGVGEVRVRDDEEEVVLEIDAGAWAAHLTGPEDPWPEDSDIVPVATRWDGPLPIWAADELDEAIGAWGGVLGLVDGEVRRIRSRDR